MQKLLKGFKFLFAAVLSAALMFCVTAFSACGIGETTDGENNSQTDGGSTDNSGSTGDSGSTDDSESGGNTEDSGNGSEDGGNNNDGNTEDGDNDGEQSALVSGEYIVDVSWTGGMHNYMTLVVSIDAENMTFNQYYASDTQTSKGSGSITLDGGVYTMTYADISVDGVNTATFTFGGEDSVITFTSALLWGTRSFDSNSTTADGSFATYQAQPIVASGEYIVDLEWTGGMAAYVTAIVNIDMSSMSFNLYYQSSPGSSKGTGKVIYSDGVYTMIYSEAVNEVSETTFIYDYTTKTITFTSALLWGSSSFDSSSITADGSFATYQAQSIVASGEYNVDLGWTGGMAAYVTAIVNIDMSTMSFNLYYQSSS